MIAPRRRGYFARRWAVRGLRGLSAGDKAAITAVLDEYAAKVSAPDEADPTNLSELEFGLLSDLPSWREKTRETRTRLETAVQDLTAARSAYLQTQRRVRAFPPAGHAASLDEEESVARAAFQAVTESTRALRELRENVEAQLALRRFVAKWLVVAVDALVFASDFLLFWQTLITWFNLSFTWSIADVIGVVASFLFSLVGPTIVVVSAIVLARVLSLNRAERAARRLGIQMQQTQVGQPAPQSRSRKLLRVLTTPDVPDEWSTVARWSVFLLVAIGIVYTITFKVRLTATMDAIGDSFPGQLQILAILFLALPVIAFVANAAASNPLRDAVEEAEDQLEVARRRWERARIAQAQHSAEIESQKERLSAARDAALNAWTSSWQILGEKVAEADIQVHEDSSLYVESRRRLLAVERGINDRLPLAIKVTESSELVKSALPSVEVVVTRLSESLLRVPRAALDDYTPPSEEE